VCSPRSLELPLAAGLRIDGHERILLALGGAAALSGAVYPSCGAVVRMRKVRRERARLGGAARWFHLACLSSAPPVLVMVGWAVTDLPSLVGGGFRPLLGIALVGGCTAKVASPVKDRRNGSGAGRPIGSSDQRGPGSPRSARSA
jgi:hypothetical protein